MRHSIATLLVLVCTLLWVSSVSGKESPTCIVQDGTIEGKWIIVDSIAAFNGIPYAQPPIGNLRWKPPQPVIPWSGVKETNEFSAWASQYQSGDEQKYVEVMADKLGHSWFMKSLIYLFAKLMPAPETNEDCLYLNVRTGNLAGDVKQPVMVWIHGGAKQFGSGAEPYYHSNALIEKGIVVVTINFRLGLLGYFAHPDLTSESPHNSSGNYGMLDQIAALRWVKENIEQFGGDPNNVTIAGQSSGGESVAELLSSPLARGLFHRAIMQSGTITTLSEATGKPMMTRAEAERAGKNWAQRNGFISLEQLRATPADSLLELLQTDIDEYGYPYHTVVVDEWSFPLSIVHTFQNGRQARVPLLTGYTADEGTLFYPMAKFPTPSNWARPAPESVEDFNQFLRNIYESDTDSLLALYDLDSARLEGEIAMRGDDQMGVQSLWLCRQMEKLSVPSYLYIFSRTAPGKRQTAGAYHFIDIPFLFGTHDIFFKATKEDLILREKMQSYWVNFMKQGNPNSENLPQWNSYSQKSNRWFNINHHLREEPISRIEQLTLLEKTLIRKIKESDL